MVNIKHGLPVKQTLLFIVLTILGASVQAANQPKLILQITVDALRGDLPQRFSSVMGDGGFRYLMDNGIHYTNAHYQHANTETIVGHASLATGSTPAAHGMVANVWFDRELGRLAYNIEDADYRLLTAGADVDQKSEIDPTQKTARVDGRSPRNIITSTLSDEMAIHFAGKSKIFAVSVKDRGAVSLAGHAGKAFWFSKASGEFVTSNYYYQQYPEWINEWNAARPAMAYSGKAWQLTHPVEKYMLGDADDKPYETDLAGFGRTFPHAYGTADDKYFTTKLTLSPAGDELTLDFARTLLDKEQLGQDEVPDYLSISFSSTDYVGHIFGASSLETEDNLARLDRTLADLFAYVDKKVGLENTLIVLSADHGQPEVPGYMNELGINNAHYFDTEALDKTPAIEALKKQFGIGEELIEAYFHPYLYLNYEQIRKKGLDQATVERAVASELMKLDGIAYAVSSTALRTNRLPDNLMTRSILHNFHPKRSGDIYLVFEPNVFINDFDGLTVAATHGSPWRYDSYVPVIFAGAGLPAAKVSRLVTPYDIAPTLAAYLNIKTPSGAVGMPLQEVVQK
ncbi:MAG: alkaline phosphatase family protein [Gammaproteobacteria bacterium]|nr:alkaline phosphatase family protein [Gammaproteobacteria bacterium]NNJ50067.1 alkaline phosphatase family protein [Gammaproteobacteria bacterium]